MRIGLGLGGLFLLLACGGFGGGSSQAVALCEHMGAELDAPCFPMSAGSTAQFDDLEFRVDAVKVWEGTSELPAIKNRNERARLKRFDHQTIVLEVSYTNTAPVKVQGIPFVTYLIDGNGDEQYVQPGNSQVYTGDREGWVDLWRSESFGPGKTRQGALVFAADATSREGAKLILRQNTKRPDPNDPAGRMKVFTDKVVVMDLGPPT